MKKMAKDLEVSEKNTIFVAEIPPLYANYLG